MVKLHFNFKDIFRAPRLAFSPKKIWIQFLGFLFGWLGYFLLTYLAVGLAKNFGISEYGWAETWNAYKLFPLPIFLPWSLKWIWLIGIVWMIVMILLADAAVSKVTLEQLQGNDFYEVKESLGFVKKNWRAVIFSPIAIFLFALFFIVCGIILGWLGRIPWIGELVLSLFTIFIFFVCLFIVFLLISLYFSRWLAPAVVGTTNSDTFDTLFEIFSTVTTQPWRLVVYSILLVLLVALSGGIFIMASHESFTIADTVLGQRWVMGEKYYRVVAAAMGYLPTMRQVVPDFISRIPCCGENLSILFGGFSSTPVGELRLFPFGAETLGNLPVFESISAFIVGIFLWLIFLMVFAYPKAVLSVGYTLIYIVLTQKKDNKNLLEKKEERREEWKPPEPVVAEKKEEEKKEEEKK